MCILLVVLLLLSFNSNYKATICKREYVNKNVIENISQIGNFMLLVIFM